MYGPLITDYTLKSCISKIIDRDSRNSIDVTSINRTDVIATLWSWINLPEKLHEQADADALLRLLRRKFGDDSVIDTGIVDNHHTYKIHFSNVTFYIMKLEQSYLLSAGIPITKAHRQSVRPSKQVLGYMLAFNELMPDIQTHIDNTIAEVARDNMLCHITAATGRGIVDQLRGEGVEIPEISCIRGTANGRVILYFADSDEKINSPMDHLRARLIRRFYKSLPL